uniref:Uncharacterized protein n=1 Tax=Anguilla anguilla TaxID=7936 RepID=A0A0E9UDC2_ANGAN
MLPNMLTVKQTKIVHANKC